MIERSDVMNKEGVTRIVLKIILCLLVVIGIERSGIMRVPNDDEIVDFQFGLITVSTVFAGFSLTTIGMLLSMFSEPMMQRLKDTSIVTRKSEKLMKSIMYFCASGLISLIFILRVDLQIVSVPICGEVIVKYMFDFCVLFLIAGILYFVVSTVGVFRLISIVYGCNVVKYKEKKEAYQKELQLAKERLENKKE